MPWKKLLVWATGQIDEALRQKLEFVLEENRVYRTLIDRHSPHWRLQDAERKALAEKFGLTHFVNPKEIEGDLVAHLVALTDGGADPTGIAELVQQLNEQYGITLSIVKRG